MLTPCSLSRIMNLQAWDAVWSRQTYNVAPTGLGQRRGVCQRAEPRTPLVCRTPAKSLPSGALAQQRSKRGKGKGSMAVKPSVLFSVMQVNMWPGAVAFSPVTRTQGDKQSLTLSIHEVNILVTEQEMNLKGLPTSNPNQSVVTQWLWWATFPWPRDKPPLVFVLTAGYRVWRRGGWPQSPLWEFCRSGHGCRHLGNRRCVIFLCLWQLLVDFILKFLEQFFLKYWFKIKIIEYWWNYDFLFLFGYLLIEIAN